MANSTSVFLNVHNIDKALEFYKLLGFKITSATKGDEGRVACADLALDGAEVGLGAIPTNDDPGFRAWVGTPLGAGVVVYFSVRDVDPLFAKAKKAGAVVEQAPQDRSYGRVFTINDPDGYVLSFIDEKRAKKSPARKASKKSAARKKRRA